MSISKLLILLSGLVALLAFIMAGAGFFWPGGDGPFPFTTLHDHEVEIYGRGLYHYDTALKANIQRGTDAIVLVVGLPLLVAATLYYRRGSLRGHLLLLGALFCFLYVSASLAFGMAYNPLFLLYVACFSASLYAFILAFATLDLPALAANISPRLPRRGIAIFLFIAGLSTGVWLVELIPALLTGTAPVSLGSYTTDVTAILDLGIILPACYLAGVLLLRRAPLGYPLAATLLIMLGFVGLVVVGQTIIPLAEGIVLRPADIAIYVLPFLLLSLVAIWLTASLLRNLQNTK